MKSHKPAMKKSAMAREAERTFPSEPQQHEPTAYDLYPTPASVPVIVQTFTTYSVCEDPIPNPYKKP